MKQSLPQILKRIVLILFRRMLLPFERNHIYINYIEGARLGNQMFMLAYGKTLSEKLNMEVRFYTIRTKYLLFDIQSSIFDQCKIYVQGKSLCFTKNIVAWEYPKLEYEYSLRDDLLNGNIAITGYFEGESFFNPNIAKKIFRINQNLRSQIMNQYNDLSERICVHVRRGDFVDLGLALPITWYEKAMSIFPAESKFIFVSDDIEWCKSVFSTLKKNIVFVDRKSRSVYFDLYLPSLCFGNIISCSTFSWWSAWLNDRKNKTVVAPYPWNGDESKSCIYTLSMVLIDKTSLERLN